MSTDPKPTFSRVLNLIFLKATVCQLTSTLPKAKTGVRYRFARRALLRDQHAAFQHRLGVVIHLMSLGICDLAIQIEVADEEGLSVVQIDGFWDRSVRVH